MIDFRYHVVSIVAVLLALALGLFLGSTTLQGAVFNDLDKRTKGVAAENRRLETQANVLRSEIAGGRAFADAVEPFAVAGRLSGQTVVVVSAPGVDGDTRKRLEQVLVDAGATVSADIRLRDAYVDPRQDGLLGSLAERLAGPGKLPQGSGQSKAAAQLASVLVARPGTRAAGAQALETSLTAYADGSLLQVANGTAHPGTLAVVLGAVPSTNATPDALTGENDVLMTLAQALDRTGAGAALAAPAAAAASPGVLAVARGNGPFSAAVSTVDGIEDTTGRVALVFALAQQLSGGSGSYGSAAGASGALPRPSAAP